MKSNKILIMGLGHLARFMVKELIDIAELWGTYRHKLNEPAYSEVHRVAYSAGDTLPHELAQDWGTVIWNFPPFVGYKEVLQEFNSLLPQGCPWVFVSSTSVFSSGNINEESIKNGSPRGGTNLIEIEEMLAGFERSISIIRPGGLVDEARHPVNFLRNKSIVTCAQTQVNLVHTHDVARFMRHMVTNRIVSEDFNLVSDTHISKEEFYSQIMRAKNIIPPKWDDENSANRIISNHKSKSVGFNYKYPDLLRYFLLLADN